MKVITSIDDAAGAVGTELGVSDWLDVDQARIDAFAEATGDHQWIHVDPLRAITESPYGTTIAHGLLTLSLIPALSKPVFRRRERQDGNQLRAQQGAVYRAGAVGSRLRVRSDLVDVTPVNDATVHLTIRHTVEVDGIDKPAAAAEMIARYVF
ncbi:Acyl dehydratase [Mycobacterium rhizamassiliense]|uniref:Acyl dehydratase n=2 Tax=Mycobacterium TaxID=1763 RepID=A0A2U3PAH3_9MYCO|nr:Acyl dehydratase [Mycobacterium rhizamassiliense]SPM40675.1 Acyl dehydratase [Mycobacterium numidiamassiliense]